MSENFSKERILKNSLLLYVRMLFTMWLNLYATRLTLTNLGIEDMGVYGVIGSIVSLFTVFTGGITSAVQRFITFELGLKDGRPNKVFCSSLNVIFMLSALMLVLLEVCGLWMLNNKINIPEASRDAAFWVFQLSVLTCIVNTISIPYNALIIAHERMNAFAVISIVQVVLNFLAAYCLTLFVDNRLLIYAILLAAASVFVRLLYQIYCHRQFSEAEYHWNIDWTTIKQIGKFTGITTFASTMQLVASQGIVFVINWTFGVTINAIYTIALQLKNAVLSFSLNIERAIAPQITKTYANKEFDTHKKLVYSGCKLEVFFIYLIMIPFLFRTEYIMKLWLDEVPKYTVIYVQCIIFVSLINALYEPIRTAVLATNRIKQFMIVPNVFNLVTLPIGYLIAKTTNSPVYLILSIVITEIITYAVRIYYATKVSQVSIKGIIKNIVFPSSLVAILSSICCHIISYFCNESIIGLLILLLLNSTFLLIIIYTVGMNKTEINAFKNMVCNFRNIIKSNRK